MTKLTDLAPGGRTVTVRGKDVNVPGVGAAGIAALMKRFGPQLKTLQTESGGISVDQLVALGPVLIAAVIAAGTGTPGDENCEAIAAGLGGQAQLDLLAAIIEETMPGGLDPFVARFQAIAAVLGPDLVAKVEAAASPATAPTSSPPQSTS